MPDEGVVLISCAHPIAPWWRRAWMWLTAPYWRWRMSRYIVTEERVDDDLYDGNLFKDITGVDL